METAQNTSGEDESKEEVVFYLNRYMFTRLLPVIFETAEIHGY